MLRFGQSTSLVKSSIARAASAVARTNSSKSSPPPPPPAPSSMVVQPKNFSELLENVEKRLLQNRLNRTNRNLALRARRAKELLQRKNPVIVEGQKLTPMTPMGPAGRSHLHRLISTAETEQDLDKLEPVIRAFGIQHQESVDPVHLRLFLLKSAEHGRLSQATEFLFKSHVLGKHVNDRSLQKELLRMYAILGAPSRKLFRAFGRLDKRGKNALDINLLMAAGLQRCLQAAESQGSEHKIISASLESFLNKAKQNVDAIDLSPESLKHVTPIDFAIAGSVLDLIGGPKLAEIKAVVSKRAVDATKYIDRVKSGVKEEKIEDKSGKSSESFVNSM